MKPDDLDHFLSRETEIIPSSGFVSSVMGAVRSEAAAPPPIPFPWKRALPGLVVWAVVLVSIVVDRFRTTEQPSASALPSMTHFAQEPGHWIANAEAHGAGWILFALLLTLGCLKLTWYLADRAARFTS